MARTVISISTGGPARAIDTATLFAVLSKQLAGHGFTGACRITLHDNQCVIEDSSGVYTCEFKPLRRWTSDEFVRGG